MCECDSLQPSLSLSLPGFVGGSGTVVVVVQIPQRRDRELLSFPLSSLSAPWRPFLLLSSSNFFFSLSPSLLCQRRQESRVGIGSDISEDKKTLQILNVCRDKKGCLGVKSAKVITSASGRWSLFLRRRSKASANPIATYLSNLSLCVSLLQVAGQPVWTDPSQNLLLGRIAKALSSPADMRVYPMCNVLHYVCVLQHRLWDLSRNLLYGTRMILSMYAYTVRTYSTIQCALSLFLSLSSTCFTLRTKESEVGTSERRRAIVCPLFFLTLAHKLFSAVWDLRLFLRSNHVSSRVRKRDDKHNWKLNFFCPRKSKRPAAQAILWNDLYYASVLRTIFLCTVQRPLLQQRRQTGRELWDSISLCSTVVYACARTHTHTHVQYVFV